MKKQTPINEFKRGWAVLLASFLGIGVSLVSLLYYSAGIWIKPWQEAFNWTRTEIGFGQTLMTLTLVLTAPFAGKIIDRFGLKKISTLSLFLYALSIFAISRMNGELWVYYVLMVILTVTGIAATPLAFTQGVNAWFDKNRGLALGLSLTSTGVAAFFIPKYLTPYVAENGWRAGYFVLFVIVMIVLPIVWLLIKDHPPEAEGRTEEGKKVLQGLSFKEARQTRTFWSIAAIFLLVSIAVLGLIPSFIPLLQDAGLSPKEVDRPLVCALCNGNRFYLCCTWLFSPGIRRHSICFSRCYSSGFCHWGRSRFDWLFYGSLFRFEKLWDDLWISIQCV